MGTINDCIPKSIVPEGESGDWKVIKFEVDKEDAEFFNLRQMMDYVFGRNVEPGNYTKLINSKEIVMSDTPAEVRDHFQFYHEAYGNVLINGLGLGLIARAVLLKSNVDKVTINELSGDVITLSAPTLKKEFGERVVINFTSAFTWHPNGERFNAVWHDIWNEMGPDNHEEMKKLHRRYGRWLSQPAFNSSWGHDYVKKVLREERGVRYW